ncbi:MAG: hypothetical protein WED10_13155 [Brumimicrobium sp.]
MKNILFTISTLLLLAFASCDKCDPSNDSGGAVVKNAIVRVIGGEGGANFITNDSQYDAPIEMSLDGGETYTNVDFTEYSVFSLPTTASCSSGYHRSVLIDEVNATVSYTINITECEFCEGTTSIMNWVLTTAISENFTPIYDVNKN